MSQNNFPRVENINGQDHLIIAIPMQQPEISSTGKSWIIAKTGWNKTTYMHQGKQVTITGMAMIPLK